MERMRVGFDTEFSSDRVVDLPNGKTHMDVTGMRAVCACLYFEDGREVRVTERWEQLQEYFDDPRYCFLVHNATAEYKFCRLVGLRFPKHFLDTFLIAVMVMHAAAFKLSQGVYKHASLASVMTRYHLPFTKTDEKDEIRDSIMRGTWQKFGMQRVLEYCMSDAHAVVKMLPHLKDEFKKVCGERAEYNLTHIYQPYALAMAGASWRGLRLDQTGWERLKHAAPGYRNQRVAVMKQFGYDHDGEGIGGLGFEKMIRTIGLDREWSRTPTKKFSTTEDSLEEYRDHPAINAALEMKRFDGFMNQDLGLLMDHDGRIRCSIQPLKQHTGRNSTVTPNLMGMPSEMRPLLLPDDGCVFVHFDYSQQEPGIAAWLSRDAAMWQDFMNGDVYINLGRRLGLLKSEATAKEIKKVRKVMKVLMLAILYGKSVRSVARDLGVSFQAACADMNNFRHAYCTLFAWLKSYITQCLERGWAENIIGFRAAFDQQHGINLGHLTRSCQNFSVQSAAAASFQLTGIYLAELGCDIRLPLHDAYLLNCINDRRVTADMRKNIIVATGTAVGQLFPGLPPKRDIEVLDRFAKDGNEDSFERWLADVEAGICLPV